MNRQPGIPARQGREEATRSGNLDPDLRFWHFGGAKFVYCPAPVADKVRALLGDLAEVHALGETADLPAMLEDLWDHGVRKLMVEGGGTIHTQFLQADLVDEIQLAVAPFLLGDPAAPRFANPGTYPDGPGRRMQLAEVLAVGDVAVLRYIPSRTS